MADLLNSHTKIVFSKRLTTLEWNNSRVASADATEEIARLKQQTGKDISVTAGATLAQSLSRLGLIEEYNLVSAQTFDSGAIGLTYKLA